MSKKQKMRMRNWYWGNYCVRLSHSKYIDEHGHVIHLNETDLEPYIEEEHGWHHSEEHQKGYPKFHDK